MPGDGRKLTGEGRFHVLAKPEFVAMHIQLQKGWRKDSPLLGM
jgi:hypothetical protein